METIYAETDHVVTLPEHCGGAGDISPATALGAVMATKACAERVWGTPSLQGRRVALQGLGTVGGKALALLLAEGADVVVTDLDKQKVTWARDTHGVAAVEPEEIYRQDADIFAPYALGGIINDETIPQLRCRIIAGSANNILAEERHGDELERLGMVYAVDYVANSGGTIFDTDRLRKGGFQRERAMANVRRIFERVHEIFEIAAARQLPLYRAADLLAEQRIAGLRSLPLLDAPRPRT